MIDDYDDDVDDNENFRGQTDSDRALYWHEEFLSTGCTSGIFKTPKPACMSYVI